MTTAEGLDEQLVAAATSGYCFAPPMNIVAKRAHYKHEFISLCLLYYYGGKGSFSKGALVFFFFFFFRYIHILLDTPGSHSLITAVQGEVCTYYYHLTLHDCMVEVF